MNAKAAIIALFTAALPYSASAEISGNINATITLTTACRVNNVTVPDTTTGAAIGSINFGVQNSYFSTADAQLIGAVGNGIVIQCSNGIAPTLSFSGGAHAGSGSSNTGTTGTRAMKHATAAQFVTYNLYQDASGGSSPITVNGTIALAADGAAHTVPVFGRAFGADGLITGAYDDIVVVTVTFQ